MKLDVYFIDAFADKVFTGNPAAVIFTDIDDEKLIIIYLRLLSLIYQKTQITSDGFLLKELIYVDMLASGFAYFNFINKDKNEVFYVCKWRVIC